MLLLKVLLEPNNRLVENLRDIAQTMGSGVFEHEIELAMADVALSLIVEDTPIISGSWRSAWAIYVIKNKHTQISLAPEAINPLGIERPIQYAPKVHRMGGRSRSGHVRAVLDVFKNTHEEEVFQAGNDAVALSLDMFG